MDPLRVLVVSADPLSRAGLAALLAGQPGVAVVGQAAPDAGVLAAIASGDPEAVAWDLGSDGPVSFERLREAADGGLPVLALLAVGAEAREALGVGARGALPRAAPAEKLAAGLLAVARGLVVLDGTAAHDLLRSGPAAPSEGLTPRELEVLSLLAEGLPNKAIAARLGVSEHTAKFHVNSILGKLGAGNRAEAIVRAARLGLVVL